jgi:hypothetical protein
LGLILRQARAEIVSVIKDEESCQGLWNDPWFLQN